MNNLQQIIEEWIGEDHHNDGPSDWDNGYHEGYNQALEDFRERVTELVRLITESEILAALRELKSDMTRVEKSIDKLESPDYD